MAKTVRPVDRDQMLLMPPSLPEWVPEDHLARFVDDLIETLDLQAIEDTYTEARGYPPYHPRMMVAVLLYAYCTGTFASRKIETKLVDSVAFRFLAAGNTPDLRTISEFRRRHGPALAGLFTQDLRRCRQAGLVKLGRVAIDGTRIKEAALTREVEALLRQAEAADREDDQRYGVDRRGDELPAELARRETRLTTLREAQAALEAQARTEATAAGKDPDGARPTDKAQRCWPRDMRRRRRTKTKTTPGARPAHPPRVPGSSRSPSRSVTPGS